MTAEAQSQLAAAIDADPTLRTLTPAQIATIISVIQTLISQLSAIMAAIQAIIAAIPTTTTPPVTPFVFKAPAP
jgi:hypothetical protein